MKIIKTKIFCDSAELKVIKKFNKKNIKIIDIDLYYQKFREFY